jgi:hypothetical protein
VRGKLVAKLLFVEPPVVAGKRPCNPDVYRECLQLFKREQQYAVGYLVAYAVNL